MHPSQPPQSYQRSYPVAVPVPPPPSVSSNYMSPAMSAPPYGSPMQWTTGLCHCFDDPANCVITCFCPCITFGQIAEILNQGSTSCTSSGMAYGLLLGFTGFACLYSCFYRSILRAQYDLQEASFPDCLVHFCCETCALCQEYRELKNRGFDMGIGWKANMDRKSRGVMTVPTIGGAMMR